MVLTSNIKNVDKKVPGLMSLFPQLTPVSAQLSIIQLKKKVFKGGSQQAMKQSHTTKYNKDKQTMKCSIHLCRSIRDSVADPIKTQTAEK